MGAKCSGLGLALNAPSGLVRPAVLLLKGNEEMKRLIAVLAVLAASGSVASMAQASTRSYSLPTDGGKAISACLADGSTCGKPAADQFCKMAGYSESILFQRQAVAAALVLDGAQICEGDSCQAFTRIKCYTPTVEEQASAE